MRKVLVISTIGIGYEGISSVIYNFLSNIHSKEIAVDVAVYKNIRPTVLKDFEKVAGIKYVQNRKQSFLGYVCDLKRLLPEYSVVHINGNSSTMLIEYYMAKICGVKHIILHNHSASTGHPWFNEITKPLIRNANAIKLACSPQSGDWLFGTDNYEILSNAIAVSRFSYNEAYRNQVRSSLNIDGAYFVGHIGHFTPIKNHEFIIDVFSELVKVRHDAILGLVSDGPSYDKIKKMVEDRNLSNKVLFLGRQDKPERFYSAFDSFLFPSISEGFGLVAIEAQASGLPVLASTGVPLSTKCSNIILYKDLSAGAEEWAKELLKISNRKIDRGNPCWRKNIEEKGLDITQQAKQLLSIYLAN